MEGILIQEGAVGKNVHLAAFEPGMKNQIVYVGQQKRLTS